MDKQEMLTKIYEVIADKTLSFGCKIKWTTDGDDVSEDNIGHYTRIIKDDNDIQFAKEEPRTNSWILTKTIIGHPVMIGDVLDWCFENSRIISSNKYDEIVDNICTYYANPMRKEKRQPIDNQSIDCIKYVYDLLQ